MFHDEVPVKNHGFNLRQVVIVSVNVTPAGLDHPDAWVGKVVNGLRQKFWVGNEVCVENGDEFALCDPQARFEGACLESSTIVAVQVVNVNSLLAPQFNGLPSHMLRFIGRIIQKLNFKKLGGIVDSSYRFHQPLNHKHFVVDWQLDRDRGHRLESQRLGYTLLISQIQIDQLISMESVNRQNDKDDEIGNENQHIKGIQDVVLASLVEEEFIGARRNEKMLQILKNALRKKMQYNHKSPINWSRQSDARWPS